MILKLAYAKIMASMRTYQEHSCVPIHQYPVQIYPYGHPIAEVVDAAQSKMFRNRTEILEELYVLRKSGPGPR